MITRDDWLRALGEAGYHEDEHDEHALTVNEFAEMLSIPKTTAANRLHALVMAGRAERTFKRAVNGYGRRITFKAYRLIDRPKRKRA